jgi:conjugative relaxase-like TrwC/TraI family protein
MMALKHGSLNAAQAETYYAEKYSLDDYYGEQQRVAGQWIGHGVAALGLAGEVAHKDFSALLQGIDPHNGAVLVQKASGYGEHAAGWDGVFNAPKSVSIQALIGEDQRLLQAHQLAVERAVAEVEKYAMGRAHGGREFVNTANIVGAAFTHVAARPVEDVGHGPDPHLHTHVVFLNITRRPDGALRALSPVEIYRSQLYGSAVYRSQLIQEVQRLGYKIQLTASNGKWELDGYTREQVLAFSSRYLEIQAEMKEREVRGPKAAQIVALSTRQAKEQYDEQELKAEWKERAAEQGIDLRQHLWQTLGRGDLRHGNDIEQFSLEKIAIDDAREAVNFSIAHNTNREAVIDRREIEQMALQHGMGRVTLEAVRRQMEQQQAAGRLIPTAYNVAHPQGAFTTDQVLDIERENIELMRERCATPTAPVGTWDEVQRWAEGRRLSAEQIAATHLALSSDQSIMAIEGFAGAAKTTTVGAIREFAEDHNYIVRGFGMTSGAVKALRAADIKAQTVASLLARSLQMPTGPEIWFVDESSLVSTEKANRILKAAREAGIERLVFVGDQGQHQSIEAGAPLRQFLTEGMPVATLQEIRRQHDPELREAVRMAHDDGRAAFDLLQEQGRITEIPDVNRRYRQIAADYLAGIETKQQTLVVSPGNDERKALNAEIRGLLVERGHVKKRGVEHEILVRRDLTPAQIAHFGSYQAADVIRVSGSRVQQRQGFGRDTYVTVEAVNRDAKCLTLRTDDGRKIEASPVRWRDGNEVAAEVYTPEKRTLAAGDHIQFRRPDNRRDIANGEFAIVLAIGSQQARIRFEGKEQRELTLPLSALRHVDYGYTVTSFSSQGSTVDKVIVNDDSMRGARLVNREQEYVSVSRAKIDARIYTDDAEALRRAVSRDPKKAIALEAVKQRPTQELKPEQQTTELKPGQSQRPAFNMGI